MLVPSFVFQLTLSPPPQELGLVEFFNEFGAAIFVLGWMLMAMLILWIVWEVYLLLKMIDYVSGLEWAFIQVNVPQDSAETPKAMEIAYDVLDGIHKNPDLVEKYFDGYLEPWYSCEIQFLPGRARYIMMVPQNQKNFFEGVIYGQYPQAEVKEVEDYTQRYRWQDLRKKFDIYGTKMVYDNDEYYAIKTYPEYENTLGEDDRYVDPHQSLLESLTQAQPGEEYWMQVLIRPMDRGAQKKFSEQAEEVVAEISGQAKKEGAGIMGQLVDFLKSIPGDLLSALSGPVESSDDKDEATLRFFNPIDEAKMKNITNKINQQLHKVIVRVIHVAPPGQIRKPNYGRLIGVFKQFNATYGNGLKPDPNTKTNGPNFIFRDSRRKFRERQILLHFQWRDHWGVQSGEWMSTEELATLYHFPVKYVKTPGVERARAGLQAPPPDIPYA